eukprot:533897-Amphidinium_carterae.1
MSPRTLGGSRHPNFKLCPRTSMKVLAREIKISMAKQWCTPLQEGRKVTIHHSYLAAKEERAIALCKTLLNNRQVLAEPL